MHRIDGDNVAVALPTPQAVGATVGYFAAEDDPPFTQVTGDWLNAVQEEIAKAIENSGITLDKTNREQLYAAITAALVGGAVSVGAATTLHKAGVLLANDCGAFGQYSLAAVSANVDVEGDYSVALACEQIGDDAPGVGGDQCFMAAVDAPGGLAEILGLNCAAIASRDPVIAALFSLIAASDDCETDASASAILASSDSKVVDVADTIPQNVTLLSSRFCSFALGADGSAQRQYAVAGGYHASTLTAPSWRIESNGGTMRSTAAHTTSGLDYAEMVPNADRAAHRPGALLAFRGDGIGLAKAGDLVEGVVSVMPTVVGGDDGLGWQGRYRRDEFGRLLEEEVEVEVEAQDKDALTSYQAIRKGLVEELRKLELPARPSLQPQPPKSAGKVARRAVDKANAALEATWRKAADAIRMRQVALAAAIKTQPKPATRKVVERVRQHVLNPAWDPTRPQVSRRERPDEWTCMGFVGQLVVEVDATVRPGSFVVASTEPGRGTHAERPDDGRRIRCRAIKVPFDESKGYALALCHVG